MNTVKIPDELYVTFKKETVITYGLHLDGTIDYGNVVAEHAEKIGFLHPHTMDKAGEKRKRTQNEWAYGEEVDSTANMSYRDSFYRDHNDAIILLKREYNDNTRQYKYEHTPLEQEYYPQVWKNTPQFGFRVKDYNSRYSTSNKLIVVEDPRGGEFEVTVEHFINLLKNVIVANGIILDPCIWVKNKHLARY